MEGLLNALLSCVAVSVIILVIGIWQVVSRRQLEKKCARVETVQQEERRLFCEQIVENFWNDFKNGSETDIVLIARLEFALENSDYKDWKKLLQTVRIKLVEIPEDVRKNRQKSRPKNSKAENLGKIQINFNGIFVTPQQYQILNRYPKVRSLLPDDVLELCRRLSERLSIFASFKEEHSVQLYTAQENYDEAYQLFNLKPNDLTEENLKQAYRRLVRKYHPDKDKTPDALKMFQKIQSYHTYLKGELHHKVA